MSPERRVNLHLQAFWVRDGGLPTPLRVRYAGATKARPTGEVLKAIAEAERIIIAPGNPMTSIRPILSIPGLRSALGASKATKVAISPMLGDRPFSGPAAGLMKAMKLEPTSTGVAELYKGLVNMLILDEGDRAQAAAIERMGVRCRFSSTLMKSHDDELRLAKLAMEVR